MFILVETLYPYDQTPVSLCQREAAVKKAEKELAAELTDKQGELTDKIADADALAADLDARERDLNQREGALSDREEDLYSRARDLQAQRALLTRHQQQVQY